MFNVTFSGGESFTATFTPQTEMTAEFGEYIEVPVADYYAGDYEITPTDQTQLIDCGGLVSLRDFVIRPIPSNYGRITWDGSVLTVQ
jgi:hypothetical protein